MKNSLRTVLFIMLATFAAGVQAQTRYLDEVFTDVTIDTTITYGQNYEYYTGFTTLTPLVMDVYRPVGDVATNRPLILLSHSGSFLSQDIITLRGLCFAGKDDSSMVELCKRFARRGYVAVSFDYRRGWNADSHIQEVRTSTIIQAVYRAMQDSKNLVRYFKDDFANNANHWGIDTGKIVIGGSNSGGYVALAAGSLNDTSELTNIKFLGSHGPFIKQDTLGDFNGFGGVLNHDNYPGISSRFEAVLSLGGAVGDTSWIQAGEPPVIAFQGVNEVLTPYNTAVVTVGATQQTVIEVSGSGDFMPYVVAKGNNSVFAGSFQQGPSNIDGTGTVTAPVEGLYPFYGKGFEPWNWYNTTCYNNSSSMQSLNVGSNHNVANLYIDTIMGYTTPRLYKMFEDPSYTGVKDLKKNTEISLLPNPASSSFTILNSMGEQSISGVSITDLTGRSVKELGEGASIKNIDISALNDGIYLISIKLVDGSIATKKITVKR